MLPSRFRYIVPVSKSDASTASLPVAAPYCAPWVFDFLAQRSLPGLEAVDGLCFRRTLQAGSDALVTVRWDDGHLRVALPANAPLTMAQVLPRVARVFDVAADAPAIDAALAADPRLAPQLARSPGLRVPGAWDGFEIAVRAILGQQVSVARARNLAIALCERFGGGYFPSAQVLEDADVSAIGMPGRRGGAVRALARAVGDGTLQLEPGGEDEARSAEAMTAALVALPGIGPWTAGYITMRVARDPDAYADADWVLLKQLGLTAAKARREAERWRPFRAYALMALWANSVSFDPDWQGRTP